MNAPHHRHGDPLPVHVNGAVIDLAQRQVIVPGRKKRTRLGRVEAALLRRLTHTPSQYVSPDELLAILWPNDPTKTHNSVQSVVARIRRALKGIPEGSKVVQTGYGRGYRFVPPKISATSPVAEGWSQESIALVADVLSEESAAGIVLSPTMDVRALVRLAADQAGNRSRLLFVDLSTVRSSRSALRRIAQVVGADLRGLRLERTQLKFLCQVLEREPRSLLVLMGVDCQLASSLEAFRRSAERAAPLRLLVTSAAPLPCLSARSVDLTAASGERLEPSEANAIAAHLLVQCLRALENGEYGQVLALITDPAPLCEAVGLRTELAIARARAAQGLGMTTAALRHAEEAVAAAEGTAETALLRRAEDLRDELEEGLHAQLPAFPARRGAELRIVC